MYIGFYTDTISLSATKFEIKNTRNKNNIFTIIKKKEK